MRKTEGLGYFGNIWVRQNVLEKAGESYQGHTHLFDHVSLLVSGKAMVETDGNPPKEFQAPTFIIIRRDVTHKFTALEDNTVWFCIFALRDINGEVIEDVYGMQHDPFEYEFRKLPSAEFNELIIKKEDESDEDYMSRMQKLDDITTILADNAEKWNSDYKKKVEETVKKTVI